MEVFVPVALWENKLDAFTQKILVSHKVLI